jgi:hypothetical protein
LLAHAVYAHCLDENEQALVAAEAAWEIVEQFDVPTNRADAAVVVAHIRSALQHFSAATAAYTQAINLYNTLGNTPLACEAQVGLAALALAQGDNSQALSFVETLLPILNNGAGASVYTPFYADLICYRVLAATADPRTVPVLRAAQARLQQTAEKLQIETLRHSFLEDVDIHRALQQASLEMYAR